MSLRPDGSYHCDRCGVDIANGGALNAVTLSGADPDNPVVPRVLHLCLTRDEDGATVTGCQDEVLTRDALQDYYTTRS